MADQVNGGRVPNQGEEPVVSVIIPTRNRAGMLRDCLEAFARQRLPADRFEVLVIDNRSSDGTPAMMADLAGRMPYRLVYHVMPENRGPARSRNTGVRLARGRLLAFLDDDCRPTPEWLERGVRAMAADVAFVTGQIHYKPEQQGSGGFFTRYGHEVREEHPTYSWSNLFFRRDVFLEMGGADESLCRPDFMGRVVDCGDTDLAWRTKKRGYRNTFVPDLIVHHEVERMRPLVWVLDLSRLFNVAWLVRHHPELRRRLLVWRVFFVKSNAFFYLAVVGGLLAATVHPAALLLATPYLAWALSILRPRLSLVPLLKVPAQILLMAARHAGFCAGLIYGSVRYRTLVL
jgi:glycosyltransferase involved in cell wall biosynthesis